MFSSSNFAQLELYYLLCVRYIDYLGAFDLYAANIGNYHGFGINLGPLLW